MSQLIVALVEKALLIRRDRVWVIRRMPLPAVQQIAFILFQDCEIREATHIAANTMIVLDPHSLVILIDTDPSHRARLRFLAWRCPTQAHMY